MRSAPWLLPLLLLWMAGCATIDNGPMQRIQVSSDVDAEVRSERCGRYSTKLAITPAVVWVSRRATRNVQSEYQRRGDLIPNLVRTVERYADQERDVLTEVTQARANASRIQLNADDLDDPAKVRAFNDAQTQLGGSLGRLLATFEAYPDLKSNQNFLTLQSQLEGTENSILVSRRDYNEAVRGYNTTIRTFPDAIGAKIFYGAKPKVPFEAASGSQTAPTVDFNAT